MAAGAAMTPTTNDLLNSILIPLFRSSQKK